MEGMFLDNMDIDLYISQQEFNNFQLIKERCPSSSLECNLLDVNGKEMGRKARLNREDFDDFGDGIEVMYINKIYFVKFNEKAFGYISARGNFGSRMLGGEKITISIKERMKYLPTFLKSS